MSSHPSQDIYAETLSVFDRGDDPSEPRTTPEVADALDANRRTVYKRLKKLVERGELETKKTGSRARVWWRPFPKRSHDELQKLERYEAIIQAMGDPVYALDAQGRFTFVNQALVERSGYDESELLGEYVSVGMDKADIAWTALIMAELADDPEKTATMEYEAITKDDERIPIENHLSLLTDEDGQVQGSAGVLRDLTERKKRERELEEAEQRYRTLVESFPNGAVTLVNDDLEYVIVGGTLIREVGTTGDELEGRPLRESLPPAFADLLIPRYQAALDGESSTFEETFGDRCYWFTIIPVRDESGDVFAALGLSQDITTHKEYERKLENRIRQQEVITDLGQRALEKRDLDALLAEAAELVAETLETDYCKVLDLDADAEELLVRHGVGWDDGIVGSATVSAVETDSQAAYTLEARHPIVVEDLQTESRFSGPDLLTSHDVRSGVSTIIGSLDDPWGILGTHDTACTEFSEHDVNFVQAIANVLATAINRHRDEQKLRRRREELATLDDLNSIVSDITGAVIDTSTREEIEQTVCDALAATDAYEFAWLAEVDSTTDTIEPRATAGTRGYAEDITISMDSDDPSSAGPGATAIRERETQVIADVFSNPVFEPWREVAAEYSFSAIASIPIVHSGTVYGVLGVYADRPNAFDTAEREVISQLGKVIGHAIAAERKRALMSDEIIELEFRMRDVFEAVDVPVATDGTITLDRTVSLGDGAFLEYGTATEDAMDAVEAMVESETISHWESVNVLGTDGETTHFELNMIEPPALSTVVAHGGYIAAARSRTATTTCESTSHRV